MAMLEVKLYTIHTSSHSQYRFINRNCRSTKPYAARISLLAALTTSGPGLNFTSAVRLTTLLPHYLLTNFVGVFKLLP